MDMELKAKVEKALEDVRQWLQRDGGDCEIVDVDQGIVKVRLQGACQGCPFAGITLKMRVEKIIKERVPEVVAVVAADEEPPPAGGSLPPVEGSPSS